MTKTTFIRAIHHENKSTLLLSAVTNPIHRVNHFELDASEFSAIPRSPFAYWADEEQISSFKNYPALEGEQRSARIGLSTSDDFRFVRLWWERQSAEDATWTPFAKGGAFSPYHADLNLQVKWADDGKEVKAWVVANPTDPRTVHWSRRIANVEYYGRPGLTWALRTQSGLALRVLPRGCTFGHKGPSIFVDGDDEHYLLALLALMNSKSFRHLVDMQMAFGSFEVGVIQRTPVPPIDKRTQDLLAGWAKDAWSLKLRLNQRLETSHAFTVPGVLQVVGSNLSERVAAWIEWASIVNDDLASLQESIDATSFEVYGINSTLKLPDASADGMADEHPNDDNVEDEDDEAVVESAGEYATKLTLASELVSWALGVAFGRFDIRLATQKHQPEQSNPFQTLPTHSPGMLSGSYSQHLVGVPGDYPIEVPNSEFLVDDPGHPLDVGQHLSHVFQVVFQQSADIWIKDVGDALDVQNGSLRRWISDHFFESHLRRYSRSKRKAPIYWQIALPSGRYSVWLYAPKLTRDSMFRLLQDVLAPKVAHEAENLASLRQGAEFVSAHQQRAIEDQEKFVSELRQLKEEIELVAPAWNANLDDGVVLAMAPLWRLVPRHKAWQRELRSRWQDLQSGKIDWTHVAMHLWPERVIPKCAEDRSVAIAHGLEDAFWFEDEAGKWKARNSPLRSIDDLVAERTSPAVKEALRKLLEAPDPVSPSKRTRKSKAA